MDVYTVFYLRSTESGYISAFSDRLLDNDKKNGDY